MTVSLPLPGCSCAGMFLQYVSVYCCVAICLIVCTALDVKDHTKLVSDAADGQVHRLRQLCIVGQTDSGLAGVAGVP